MYALLQWSCFESLKALYKFPVIVMREWNDEHTEWLFAYQVVSADADVAGILQHILPLHYIHRYPTQQRHQS